MQQYNHQLDSTNRSALEFNRSMSEEMQKICAPLRNFEISFFTYVRFFNDGTRLYLSSSLGWVELYINNNLQDVTEHVEHYVPPNDIRYSLWSSFKKDKVFDAIYEFKHWHGFTIYEKHKDYTDFFDFVPDRDNNEIVNFYLNNINLLESFVQDFKRKAAHAIDPADKSKLMVPKNKIIVNNIQPSTLVEEDKVKDFMKQTGFNIQLLNS